ncbi:Uncharacterized protein FWK35_00022616 [Aphis craccivora]|uniref:Uncharacterized protein n=1 Tax=Aphis craccivora TaxID=307492 RepID=A0A6G0Y3J2_APHCR|nr:Uncharacterized protein FWK35_00022616 [Aphis craccivora]
MFGGGPADTAYQCFDFPMKVSMSSYDIEYNKGQLSYILDSERSDGCIDFTMMCVFFFLFFQISNYGGGFRCKSEYPWCIIEVKNKHFPKVFKKIEKKKNDGITGSFTQTSFEPNRFFFLWFVDKKISNFYEICRKRENLQD